MRQIVLEDNEYELLLQLLSEFAEELSNRGCNDYKLKNIQENLELVRKVIIHSHRNDKETIREKFINEELEWLKHEMNSNSDEIYTVDWLLVEYLISVLKGCSSYKE